MTNKIKVAQPTFIPKTGLNSQHLQSLTAISKWLSGHKAQLFETYCFKNCYNAYNWLLDLVSILYFHEGLKCYMDMHL